MEQDKNVIFPNEMLEEMQLEGTVFPTIESPFGIAMFSEVEENNHVLRVYQLLFESEQNSYVPIQELAAFQFPDRETMMEFKERLPHLNGIEMLMILNPLESSDSLII